MYILTNNSLTITDVDLRPHTFDLRQVSDKLLGKVMKDLERGRTGRAIDRLTPKRMIEKFVASAGVSSRVTFGDGVVRLDGKPLHNYTTERVIEIARRDLPVTPLLNFIAKVADNPSYRAQNDLYRFLEANNLPISHDGNFVAYKVVRRISDGLVDCHSGTFSNNPGDVVEMPRNKVNEDPSQTCSAGLHVCGWSYIPHFGGFGQPVIAASVNPADVVAVPHDYNDAKMRVCKYRVLRELADYEARENVLSNSVLDYQDPESSNW